MPIIACAECLKYYCRFCCPDKHCLHCQCDPSQKHGKPVAYKGIYFYPTPYAFFADQEGTIYKKYYGTNKDGECDAKELQLIGGGLQSKHDFHKFQEAKTRIDASC